MLKHDMLQHMALLDKNNIFLNNQIMEKTGVTLTLQPDIVDGATFMEYKKNMVDRAGYIGFDSAANNHMAIVNELEDGNINFATNGSGQVTINGTEAATRGANVFSGQQTLAGGYENLIIQTGSLGSPLNNAFIGFRKYEGRRSVYVGYGWNNDHFYLENKEMDMDINLLTNGTGKLNWNTKVLATEEFVNAQIANVIETAPEALNTLNELANALGNDPNFATTIATQIGTKANSTDLETTNANLASNTSNIGLLDARVAELETMVSTLRGIL